MRRRIYVLLAFALLLVPLIASKPALATPAPSRVEQLDACGGAQWWDRAAVPVLQGRALGVTVGDAIYVLGGRPNNTDYSKQIYRYDTGAGNWSALAQALPDDLTSNMAGALLSFPEGQRIFVVGGSHSNDNPDLAYTSRAFTFDPASGALASKAAWPVQRRVAGGWAVVRNKLYVFGGFYSSLKATEGQDYDEIWSYDPMGDAWARVPARLSVPRGYIATEAMPDGSIYLAGGSQFPADALPGLKNVAIFEKFDPATNTIAVGPPPPVPTSNNHGYNVNGRFVVPTGGSRPSTTTVQTYDPATNRWSQGPSALHPVRNYAKGYGRDGAIYVIGGTDDSASYFNFTQALTCAAAPSPSPSPSPGGTPPPALQGDPLAFPAGTTSFTVAGVFRAQWEGRGGLAINGYPLSAPFQQRLEDGNEYWVQYFERVRMELHADPQGQPLVLLGQFGRRLHPLDPPAASQADATYFAETQHNLSGGFLAYWQANGGLAQFGFPLSEVIREKLEDGQEYDVQYFERARFEYHRDGQGNTIVLLGQFGRRVLAEVPR